ncbi:LUD domain-containing protein [Aeromonas cavernicola]
MPNKVVRVSGASKTADIQQTLAYGGHGPCRLLAVLVENK